MDPVALQDALQILVLHRYQRVLPVDGHRLLPDLLDHHARPPGGHIGQFGNGAARGVQPPRIGHQGGQRLHRRFYLVEDRDRPATGQSMRTWNLDHPAVVILGHEHRQDGLGGVLGQVAQGVTDAEVVPSHDRHVQHDDGIGIRVRDRRGHRLPELGDIGGVAQQHGITGHVETVGLAGVGGEHAECIGVPDDRDPAPAGKRLERQQARHIEQLGQGIDLHDPGLLEHGVDRLRRQRCAAHRVPQRQRLRTASRAHRHDRLARPETPRHPRELAGVTDAFQVQQNQVGGVVVLPVLQQIVRGDVGAVAGRDERGHTEPAVAGRLEQGHAQRTGLREEADPSPQHLGRDQRRVELHVRIRVHDPERIGADDPQPVRPGVLDEALLQGTTVGSGLGEPRADNDGAHHTRPTTVGNGIENLFRWERDHSEVDGPGG